MQAFRCKYLRFANKLQLQHFQRHISTSSRLCDSEKDENNSKEDDSKKKDAKRKLDELLAKIVKDSFAVKDKVDVSHPVKRITEKRPVYKLKTERIKDEQTAKLITAVKDVADDIGGDVKQTEAELLHVLLNNKKPGSLTSKGEKTASLSDIISNMKVEKEKPGLSRASQVKNILSKSGRQRAPQSARKVEERSKLFDNDPIGIFSDQFKGEPAKFKLNTWEKMEQKELKLMVTHPPRNIYEEMIMWTEQGKLWHLPLDNEQGLEEEKKVDFSEHVFLDEHLEPWCPSRGPIRHFMELVLVGLSKNPYITVEAKKEHILWFRDYFEEKKKLLTEVGALETITDEPKQELDQK